MKADSPHWRVVGEPATAAEATALDDFRQLLPDVGTIAWSNVSFRDEDGNDNEVDVILLSNRGLFVVELKGWSGTITGGEHSVTLTFPGGHQIHRKHPYKRADQVAKRLKEVVVNELSPKAHQPFVQALVVMHGQGSSIKLQGKARDHMYRLDGYQVTGLPVFTDVIAGRADTKHPLTQPQVNAIAKAFDHLGLQARPKVRLVGHYHVDDADPVAVGPGWEDFTVVHPAMVHERRRVRIFPVPPKASKSERARIQRTARREVLLTQGLHHPGIVSALELIPDTQGVSAGSPAVVFPPDPPGEMNLDTWLTTNAATLDLTARLALIQSIAEVLQYAHKHGVQHRGLTPHVVRVSTQGTRVRVRVRDWQTGAAGNAAGGPQSTGEAGGPEPADTALVGATRMVDLADPDEWVYLAPEALTVAHPDGVAMDVYGLGVLSYLIITGAPPAETIPGLEQALATGGLDASTVADALPDDLVTLIGLATHPHVTERLGSVDDFIDELTAVAAGIADAQEDPTDIVDPLDAETGTVIDDELLVEACLGSGSTGRAFLVSGGGKSDTSFVLKVANNENKAHVLIDEVAVLETLDHPQIVKARGETLVLGGRTCARLEYAGEVTLGRRLRDDGRLSWEQLQTFGNDLLEISRYLTERRVHHRDIKPDNLAVNQIGPHKRPGLVMFDFSLSRRPASDISSGTHPYLDPYLGAARGRPTYDSAAERFAIAVTQFEMATGHAPVWGDGQSDPKYADLSIAPEMFEGPHPAQVVDYFTRAMAPDTKDRFDSVEEMATAWQALFSVASSLGVGAGTGGASDVTTTATYAPTEEERDRAAMAVTAQTPLAEAGLTDRALSAARRAGAETVGDVLRLDPVAINNQPGVGLRTRRELMRRRRQWIELLGTHTWVDETPEGGRSIDDLRRALVPRANASNRDAVALAKAFVDADAAATFREIAADAGLNADALPPAAKLLTRFWGKNEALGAVAAEVTAALQAAGGVATVSELAVVLVARHGSALPDLDGRRKAAVPLVRAVVEAQGALDQASDIVANRDPTSQVVLLAQRGESLSHPESLMVAIRALAAEVDDAVGLDPAAPSSLIATAAAEALALSVVQQTTDLAEVGQPPLLLSRLVRLGALCSSHTDTSTRGELYLHGVSPHVTLPRVLHGVGSKVVSEKTLRDRLAKRYPKAAPLPDRPELDALVTAAMPGMTWNGTNYSRPDPASLLMSSTRHTGLIVDLDADVVHVRSRLRASVDSRSGLVIGVDPRRFQRAVNWLTVTYGVKEVNLASELISAAKTAAESMGIEWQFLLAVDAATGPDRAKLDLFMATVLDTMWGPLLASPEALLFTEAAVLARYGLAQRLAPLTNLATPKPAARWILVPHRAAVAVPNLDGTPVPLGADGWVELPPSMLAESLPRGA